MQMIAVRDRVKRHVVKNTQELYLALLNEINTVKRLLDGVKRSPDRSPVLPPKAAQAYFAQTLSRRLEDTWNVQLRVQACCPLACSCSLLRTWWQTPLRGFRH